MTLLNCWIICKSRRSKEGFFDAEHPYVLSMEVTLRPGEDEDIVLANTKRVLNRAWALL